MKMIFMAFGLYISCQFLVGPLVLSFMGGTSNPLAINISGLICTIIFIGGTLFFSRSVANVNILLWGKPSKKTVINATLALFAFFIGRKGLIGDLVPSFQAIIQPTKSIALDMYILAPLREEFFWRGFVMRSLDLTIGFWPSLILSSILFGIVHPNFIAAAATGLFAGFLYSPIGTGKLLMSILFHMVLNMTSKT